MNPCAGKKKEKKKEKDAERRSATNLYRGNNFLRIDFDFASEFRFGNFRHFHFGSGRPINGGSRGPVSGGSPVRAASLPTRHHFSMI